MARVARTAAGLQHHNTLVPARIRVRLFDPFLRPMPNAPYRLTLGTRVVEREADADAWVEVWVTEVPDRALVEWGRTDEVEDERLEEPIRDDDDDAASAATPAAEAVESAGQPASRYLHEVDLHVLLDADEEVAAEQRLHNLGFTLGETLSHHLESFQRAYDNVATGLLADVKSALLGAHDDAAPDPCPPDGST